jgi:hypothetical protein
VLWIRLEKTALQTIILTNSAHRAGAGANLVVVGPSAADDALAQGAVGIEAGQALLRG